MNSIYFSIFAGGDDIHVAFCLGTDFMFGVLIAVVSDDNYFIIGLYYRLILSYCHVLLFYLMLLDNSIHCFEFKIDNRCLTDVHVAKVSFRWLYSL